MRKFLIFLPLFVAAGCATSRPLPDPCSLLTRETVQKVQGAPFVEATKTVQTQGNVTVAQCFYRLEEGVRSVTLELTSAGSPHATHELWERQFEPGGEREEREREEESGKEVHGIEVHGVGDDALWSGNRVSGVLYVRTRDAILRISIGGSGKQQDKMEKAMELGRAAVGRMR
jgi:hypothetical protein